MNNEYIVKEIEKVLSATGVIIESEKSKEDENTHPDDRGVNFWEITYEDDENVKLMVLNLDEKWAVKYYNDDLSNTYGFSKFEDEELRVLDKLGFHLPKEYSEAFKLQVEDWF